MKKFLVLLSAFFLFMGCAKNENPKKVYENINLIKLLPDEKKQDNKAEIIAETNISGYFVKFSEGDYLHMELINEFGSNINLFVSDQIEEKTLEKLASTNEMERKKIEAVVKMVNIYIPESGKKEEIKVVMSLIFE